MHFRFSRSKFVKSVLLCFLITAELTIQPLLAAVPAGSAHSSSALSAAQVFSLPMHFVKNEGQTDKTVEFISRGPGYTLFLTSTQAVLSLTSVKNSPNLHDKGSNQRIVEQTDLQMNLVGANSRPVFEASDKLPGTASYFLGNRAENWHVNVPTFARVKYHEVYPGISLVYYGSQRQLEYDFIAAPHADP